MTGPGFLPRDPFRPDPSPLGAVERERLLALLAEAREALRNVTGTRLPASILRETFATLSRLDAALAAEPEARG